MRLAISSWLTNGSFRAFEEMNPLLQCVRRIRSIGSTVEIDVPFLQGCEHLPDWYTSELASLGVRVHDVSKITEMFRARYPKFREAYRTFGTINDMAILRHFVMRELLAGDPFINMDSDIVMNVRPEEIMDRYRGRTFLAGGSPCFSFISDWAWLDTFCGYASLLHDDPAAYAQAIAFSGDTNDLLVPEKADGSDQAICYALIARGLLPQQISDAGSPDQPFLIFSSWLEVGRLGRGLRYARVDGCDTIDGQKVAISHLEKNFVNLLGVYLYVREINGFEYGRIPHLRLSGVEAEIFDRSSNIAYESKAHFARVLIALHHMRREAAEKPLPFSQDPFSRRNVHQRFYESGDFAAVFNDRHWWEPGVWHSPEYDRQRQRA